MVLSECTKPQCAAKWKAKQEKKTGGGKDTNKESGQSHLNVDWDQMAGTGLEDELQSFSMNLTCLMEKVPEHYILLDSKSTHCTFYTRSYLKNIRRAPIPIKVNTNGGVMECVLEGDLPGFGPVYFNPNGIANILSLAVVEAAGRRVTYDSWDGGVFHVHNPDSGRIVDFHQLPSGLYVHDTSKSNEGQN